MDKITEKPGPYDNLDRMTTEELLRAVNQEDQRIPMAVNQVIHAIIPLVDKIVERMQRGGRLFYLGAGTSGRLGVLDASECPPTFGVSPDLVIGLIAGGDRALRHPVEDAEDSTSQGFTDLRAYQVDQLDTVIGVAASGTTPYVIHALSACQSRGILTACITCNPGSPLAAVADHPIEVLVGPEIVTGSTRMKAGTAQKMVLNMLSTSVMIKLGHVVGNRMVDMQLSNDKLIKRGAKMVAEALKIDYQTAKVRLLKYGSVRKAIEG